MDRDGSAGSGADGDAVPPADAEPVSPVDVTVARQARIYDFLLGGKDNFAADREAATQAIEAFPGLAAWARHNRAFLARAVRYLVTEAGVRQFLDIGTGLPTADNTHEVAQRIAPESRVEVTRFFAGLDLVEPGIVPTSRWRPDPGVEQPDDPAYAAMARKP